MSESATAPVAPAVAADAVRPGKGRTVAAVIVFIIAALLLPLGVVGFWGQRTVFDSARYVETVAPIAADPTIKDSVSEAVVNQVNAALNVTAAISSFLPANAQALAGPLASGLTQLVDRAVRAALNSQAFQTAWIDLNTAAQKSMMTLLEGKQSGPLELTSNGEVVLNTASLYDAVRQHMISDSVPFADKLPTTPPTTQQYVLLQSDQLARAQTIYGFTKPVLTWLLWLAIALFVVAILLARRRARMVLAVGIAFLVTAVLLKLGLAIGEGQVQLVLQNTPFATGEVVFFETLTRFLQQAITLTLIIGIVLGLCGWILGDSGPARSLRAWAGETTDSLSSGNPDESWFAAHRRLIAIGVAAIAVLIVLALMLSTTQLVIVAIAAAVIGLVLWLGRTPSTGDEPPAT